MRREFALNLTLLLAANALVKPVYLFGVDLGVQNALGTEAYGTYLYWFSFAFFFGVVYDLGLQNYNAVTLSKSPGLLRERLPVMLSLKLALAGGYLLLVLATAYATGARGRGLELALLAGAYHLSASLLQLLRTNLGAQARYRFNSLVSVADKVVLIAGLGAVLAVPALRARLTVEGFLLAQIGALALASALSAWGTELAPGQRWLRWDTRAMRDMLRATLPYGLILLLATAFTRVDVLMLEALLPDGTYEVGRYGGAYRLLDATNMIGFMFATLLLPMLSKLVAAGQDARRLFRQATGYMFGISAGAAAFTTFYGSALMLALLDDATAAWGETLAYLMWASVGVGLAYVYGSLLLAHGRLRALNYLFAGALALNVALNVWLIPTQGATGAALATAVTQLAVAAAEGWLCARVLRGARAADARTADARTADARTADTGAPGRARPPWGAAAYLSLVLAFAYGLARVGVPVWWALLVQVAACGAVGLATGVLADPRALLERVRAR